MIYRFISNPIHPLSISCLRSKTTKDELPLPLCYRLLLFYFIFFNHILIKYFINTEIVIKKKKNNKNKNCTIMEYRCVPLWVHCTRIVLIRNVRQVDLNRDTCLKNVVFPRTNRRHHIIKDCGCRRCCLVGFSTPCSMANVVPNWSRRIFRRCSEYPWWRFRTARAHATVTHSPLKNSSGDTAFRRPTSAR